MHLSTTGTKSRPAEYAIGVSTPPQSPGQTRVGCRGRGPRSCRCVPTICVQRRLAHLLPAPPPVDAVPRHDPARLAGAVHRPADDDRRGLEVVVAYVVL